MGKIAISPELKKTPKNSAYWPLKMSLLLGETNNEFKLA